MVNPENTPPEPARKPTIILAALLPVVFLVGLGVGYLLWGQKLASTQKDLVQVQADIQTTQVARAAQPTANQAAQQIVKRYDVPADDDPSIGPANAAITIIEFSDYECPYCQKWHTEVWSKLQQTYASKVRLVYRDFPLYGMHANAALAAEAANCAGDQNAYFPFHDKLLKGSALNVPTYEKYATELKLDMTRFRECYNSHKYASEVEADYTWAVNLGVQSTPTFFINGIALIGAQPYEVFAQLIDKELAGAIPK